MRTRHRLLIVLAATLLPLGLPYVSSVAAFKYLQVGMTAPPVEGNDLRTGDKVSSEPTTGDPRETICIAFWATWSPRSLEMLADLKALSVQLADEPFRVIAVNVDSQVTTPVIEERVKKALQDLDPPFPVIADKGLEIFYTYGVIAVPSMAIVGADGVVRADPSGYSYSIRDRLGESIEIALGIRKVDEEIASVPTYKPSVKASRYYYLAVQLANQRMYESALSKLEVAVEDDPGFSAPFNLRGHINLELGEIETALESFERAVALDSLSVSARAGWGRALFEANDVPAAREHLELALTIDSEYPAAMQDLARCMSAMGDPAGAIEILERAIGLNPRHGELYYHLGRVYRDSGDEANALTAFRTALQMLFP